MGKIRMKFPGAVGCFLLTAAAPLHAQPDSVATLSLSSRIFNDGVTALKCAGFAISAPSRWRGDDWLLAGGIVAGTGAVSLLDERAYDLLEHNQTQFGDRLRDAGTGYGSFPGVVMISGGVYIAGLLSDDHWVRETGVLMGGALLTTTAISMVMKFAIGRARPYISLDNHQFRPFQSNADYKSFPSGHTVAAFTLSAVLAERIKNTWASIGLYGAAGLTAASRMYSRDHWLSDVVFSGICSSIIAQSIVRQYESGNTVGENGSKLSILARKDGVMVVWRL
jgi:hypothetical protein